MKRSAALRGDELPEILTPPPGPKSRAAAKRLRRAEGAAIWGAEAGGRAGAGAGGDASPIIWNRARGSVVVDLDGNRYVDLTSGFGAASLGYAAPAVARAVSSQVRRLTQGLGDLQPHVLRVHVVRALASLGGKLSKVLLASTGSEAVELALKTASLHTGRRRVVAFDGGYHGQGGAAAEVTHAPSSPRITLPAGPPRAIHIPYPRASDGAGGGSGDVDGASWAAFEAGWRRVERECEGADPPGAVLVEPIQGRAGIIVPPRDFLPRLCALARKIGLLVIYDEIMTGAGRTGPFWAWERSGPEAEPDLLCAGKGIGGGTAVAALLGKPKFMEAWTRVASPGGEAPYASTFYAHPLACAGVFAVLTEWKKHRGETFPSTTFAETLRASLREAGSRHLVRGRGGMAAIDLGTGDAVGAAAAAVRDAAAAAARLAAKGLLVLPGGSDGRALTMLPARSLTEAQCAFAFECLRDV